MKKKLIRLTAAAALLSASAVYAGGPDMVIAMPSPFNGFYLGGSVSMHQTGFDIDGDAAFFSTLGLFPFSIDLASQDGGDSSTDAYYDVHGGWGHVYMNRWYFGVEGFADFGNADGSINNTLLPGSPIFTANLTNSAHIGTDYGVTARLGMLLSPTTLAYAKLGAVWASIKSSIDVSANLLGFAIPPNGLGSTSNSDTESAFLWGFGVEQFIYRDVVSLFAEYTFASFGSTSTTLNIPVLVDDETGLTTVGFTLDNSVSADVSAFTGGLNFHFGRAWI